jgi:hypothetical protein
MLFVQLAGFPLVKSCFFLADLKTSSKNACVKQLLRDFLSPVYGILRNTKNCVYTAYILGYILTPPTDLMEQQSSWKRTKASNSS